MTAEHCTAAQLIELLQGLSPDLPVVGAWEGIVRPIYAIGVTSEEVKLHVDEPLRKGPSMYVEEDEQIYWAVQKRWIDWEGDEDQAAEDNDALDELKYRRKS